MYSLNEVTRSLQRVTTRQILRKTVYLSIYTILFEPILNDTQLARSPKKYTFFEIHNFGPAILCYCTMHRHPCY